MIDHFTLAVTDLPGAVKFYEKALAPLGYSLLSAFEQYRGFGAAGKASFWLKHAEVASKPMHMAFAAPGRAQVDAFHVAAIAAGASDDGAPGLRADYHPNYYAAFVIDPLGHPIEAVCHAPMVAPKTRPKKRSEAKPRTPKTSKPKKSSRAKK
jgi:catechol 2,3-dioxygenase-like lactoylglutathione lyase family enzyme